MRVRWLRTALLNLDEEASCIAADEPAAARQVVARMLDAVAQLADQPGLGRPGRIPNTRELVVARTRYLVPYRVKRDAVEILRVFHTSRRFPKRW
jgi:plasmid stabilization system protein ParE